MVRRSSSKRKDKENGGAGGEGQSATASLTSLEKHGGSSGTLGPNAVTSLDSGPSSLPGHELPPPPPACRGQLKRAGSADAGGTPSHQPRGGSNHPLLCRTGSQDTPHVEEPKSCPAAASTGGVATVTSGSGGDASNATTPLTRSLPRI